MIIGETTQAANAYEKALQLGDETTEVFQNVLLLHARNNNYQQLINVADKALELYPNQGVFYYYSGYGNLMKKTYTQAIAALEQAKKLSAQNPAFLQDIGSLLGDAYQYNRDFAKSEKAYEDVLALNPDNETVLNNYAYYLSLRKANLEKAETMAKHLTDLAPNNPTYLDTYAWVLYSKQQYREAKKIMEKVMLSGKANATHLEHYGDILFKLGQTTEAISYWEKAKAINTTSETLSKKIANKTLYDQ
jgi:tetratricopeptide (TPR) repeat protein